MSKVLLVEDDNNLREIYEARLQAEGYTISTAHDGEEALAVAKTEQPDLIISDVMMPKISGFEMLDILRNTDGLKDVKVIMLTALGQSDDQQRADRLGADSYLVKSQVTLEDIVKVASRLLGNDEAAPVVAPEPAVAADPVVTAEPLASPTELPAAPPVMVSEPTPVPEPAAVTPEVAAPPVAFGSPAPVPVPEPVAAPVPEPATVPAAEPVSVSSAPPVVSESTDAAALQPSSATVPAAAPTTDAAFLQSLGASSEAVPVPAAQPLAEEAATVEAQIADFEKANSPAPAEVEPTPAEPTPAPVAASNPVPVVSGAPVPESPPAPVPAEQFFTTAPTDLTAASDPVAPTSQSAGNDDVLADALQNLTGQAPEVISVTAVPPVTEPAPSVDPTVSRGGNRVITPLDAPTKPDIHTLLALEEAKDIMTVPVVSPTVSPQAVDGPPAPAVEPVVTPLASPAAVTIQPTPPAAAGTEQPFDPNSIAL